MRLEWRNHRFDFTARTYVMGIVNTTPDSFSDGGQFVKAESAVAHGHRLAAEGADLLDVGGESTRPGSLPVDAKEECRRILPVIRALAGPDGPGIPVSVDTTKADVADAAIEAGASLINDVSGLHADSGVARVAARHEVPVLLMHMRGTPRTMQQDPDYRDLFEEIEFYLQEGIETARAAGVPRERLLIDPGIGFGKTLEHNLEIIRNAGRLHRLGLPVVVGPSRKSFIGALLDLPVNERIEGTAAAVAVAIANGADMVRVHDVGPMVRVARVADALAGKGSSPRSSMKRAAA